LEQNKSYVCVTAVLLLWVCSGLLTAQTLKITEPKDGTVVYAGQTLTVVVEASPAQAFREIIIIGPDPIGFSQVLLKPPYKFSISIPPNTRPRAYHLTADGSTEPGHGASSDPVEIQVERADDPLSLTAAPSVLILQYVGDQNHLEAIGKFRETEPVYLNESRHVRYLSDNPGVATVTEEGYVTAVGSGSARISVRYNGRSVVVPVTVPRAVTVLPERSSLYVSKSEKFAASMAINRELDQSVIWSITPALGSIDQTGLYSAPVWLSSWQGVTVTATSVADRTKSASAKVWVFPPVSVEITPPSATLGAGQFQDFFATLPNGGPKVNWTLTPAGAGTLRSGEMANPATHQPSALGTYIAPSTIAKEQTITLTATSVSDNRKSQSVKINLVPSAGVSVSPHNASLYASQAQQFAATRNYRSSLAVVWSISPNVGAIHASDASGLNATYTAPTVVTQPQTITITATGPESGGDPCIAKATVTLMPRKY
jgi:hypothetical protein